MTCPGCSAVMINGLYCHEAGCPEAWRDVNVVCYGCGYGFLPEVRHQRFCPDCEAAYILPDPRDLPTLKDRKKGPSHEQ